MERLAHIARCIAGASGTPVASPAAGAYFEAECWSRAGCQPPAARSLAAAYADHGFIVAKTLFSESECLAMQEELLRFQVFITRAPAAPRPKIADRPPLVARPPNSVGAFAPLHW
jgi:hypothetical protein